MTTMWLLHPQTFEQLQQLRDTATGDRIEAASRQARARGGSEILSVVGDTAMIDVTGILTVNPSWLAELFGGGNTTYSSIEEALAQANADPAVRRVVFAVNSPGGEVSGLIALVDAIDASAKPTEALIGGMACSAAFAIAAACGRVVAQNRSTMVGSCGVVQSFYVSASVIDVTSTEAPNKRPDVRTEKGREAVRETLDQIHDLYAEVVARGRGTTAAQVNAEYGRGGVVLARQALQRGMIDAIGDGSESAGASARPRTNPKASASHAPIPAPRAGFKAPVPSKVRVGSRTREISPGVAAMLADSHIGMAEVDGIPFVTLKKLAGEGDMQFADRIIKLGEIRDRARRGEAVQNELRALIAGRIDPEPESAPGSAAALGKDLGDAIVELWDARKEGRQPAGWADAFPYPPRTERPVVSVFGEGRDLGDAIVELRAAQAEGRKPAAWVYSQDVEEDTADRTLADAVIEVDAARKQRRHPASWARTMVENATLDVALGTTPKPRAPAGPLSKEDAILDAAYGTAPGASQ